MKRTIQQILDLQNEPQRFFNCWGFTAYYFAWDELDWLWAGRMEWFLDEHTFPIDKDQVQPNDIAVFRYESGSVSRGGLAHTAVVVDKETLLHKPSGKPFCIETLEKVKETYPYKTSYRRLA